MHNPGRCSCPPSPVEIIAHGRRGSRTRWEHTRASESPASRRSDLYLVLTSIPVGQGNSLQSCASYRNMLGTLSASKGNLYLTLVLGFFILLV